MVNESIPAPAQGRALPSLVIFLFKGLMYRSERFKVQVAQGSQILGTQRNESGEFRGVSVFR